MAVAVVPTEPAAEPLAVPAPVLAPDPFLMSLLKVDASADVIFALVPMPLTVTSLLFPSVAKDFAKEPLIVPVLAEAFVSVSVMSLLSSIL